MPIALPLFSFDDDEPTLPRTPVKVMISGLGLGGLMLAILLERACIDYEIYEQADRYIRVGSAMALGPNLFPLFEQLGILTEILQLSKPVEKVEGYTEKLKLFLPVPYHHTEKFAGYLTRVIPHPDLYAVLAAQVPEAKIIWGKKIVQVQQDNQGVTVGCTDGSTFRGEILVGADGAHSGVRKSIYKELDQRGELPRADREDVHYNGVCLLGETKRLKPEKFPRLRDSTSSIQAVYGEKLPYYWATVTTPRDTICWFVIEFFDKNKIQTAENIQRWKSQPAGEMCEALKDLPIPCGDKLTLADLMEETSRELLSKVMHEEKFFQTWYSSRAVLIGDACHKMSPAAGLGAVNAFQDAVVLANHIHALPSSLVWTTDDISVAFKGYKDERYLHAKYACDYSHNLGQLMGKSWTSEISRALVGKTPTWLWKVMLRRVVAHRPQASFLPQVHFQGGTPTASISSSINLSDSGSIMESQKKTESDYV